MFSKIKKYFSVKQMKKEIYGYGYAYSNVKYFLFIMACIAVIAGVGLVYQMKPVFLIPVLVILGLCIPSLIRARFVNIYNKKRFNEVDLYLHQMIYSFQKTPKISVALEDVSKLSTGTLKKRLEEALDILDTSTSDDIFREALSIIEKEYDNSRIKALHKYLIDIEMKGGEYATSINIMLTDIDNWINRTYTEQAEIDKIKTDTIIGIVISFVLGAATSVFSFIMQNVKYMTTQKSVSDDTMYQVSCMVFLIACILYFVYTQIKYNRDWVTKMLDPEIVMEDYKTATEFNPNAFRLKSLPIYIIIGIVGIAVFFLEFIPYHKIIAIAIALLDMYLIASPNFIKKAAVSNTKKNIQVSFSEWLRDVSLNLQHEPLIPAIQDTYETCPVVIKPELEMFLEKVEDDPTAVEPYYEFLARFHLLDISSAIRNLYSLSDVNSENIDEQLALLVKRNYEIINKNEIIEAKDRSSIMNFSECIPAFIASMKLGLDMVCLVSVML